MRAIFLRSFKDRRMSLLIYLSAIIGFIWLYVAIYPSIQAQSKSLEELLKAYPESLMKAFNIDLASYLTSEGYISSELFSFIWPLMLFFIAIGFSGAVIAGDIEKGTMEIYLSQSVSRYKIFFGKYLTGLLIIMVFSIVSALSCPLFLSAYNLSYKFANFTTMAILSIIFGFAVYSFAFFLSSIFSDKGKVFFISGGLLVIMYILNIISALKENLADLKYFSFFYYFNPTKALVHNQIDNWAYLVFLGLALIFTLLGAMIFKKRDIAV